MPVRNRIKELRWVRAGDVRPNPRNWRTHPAFQRAALTAVLAEVGCADALIARELPDGALELVDGHLRAELLPDDALPVLVLDVDEVEADKLLAALDPLAALAGTNAEAVGRLVSRLETESAELRQVFARLPQGESLAELERESAAPPTPAEPPIIEECFQLVVTCRDESQQRTLYERLASEGYACRVLTL